ncbi:MAG: hypothetical protein HYT79_00145 [Elusimicrobia bacterium]|nr:hypothetical protein [Elusimicrobiota bacterium]
MTSRKPFSLFAVILSLIVAFLAAIVFNVNADDETLRLQTTLSGRLDGFSSQGLAAPERDALRLIAGLRNSEDYPGSPQVKRTGLFAFGAGGAAGAIVGARIEPRFLSNYAQLLEEAKDSRYPYETDARVTGKIIGFMGGGTGAMAAVAGDHLAGGGMRGLGAGMAAGTGVLAGIGAFESIIVADSFKGFALRTARYGAFGVMASAAGLGASRLVRYFRE